MYSLLERKYINFYIFIIPSEFPTDLEHEVYRSLWIQTYLIIVGVRVLEICSPQPCISIIQVIEQVVYVERKGH